MSTEVSTQKASGGIQKLKATLNAPSVQEQFKNALKENKDSFVASIIDLYNGDKSLQTCSPNSIIVECLKAAVLHLPINKALGFAYIVVYNNNVKDDHGVWHKVPTPTFIPGYKGYIQLAMRTGQYRTINADMVYEGEIGDRNKLTGGIDFSGKRKSDNIIGYFCYFELLNGFSKTLYMSVEEMAKYAKRYSPSIPKETTVDQLIKLAKANTAGKKVGWMGNFNDMAIKTVIRRLISKYGYLSVDMQKAVIADTNADEVEGRDELIQENGNRKDLNLENADYEEIVDKETGEIQRVPKNASESHENAAADNNAPDDKKAQEDANKGANKASDAPDY